MRIYMENTKAYLYMSDKNKIDIAEDTKVIAAKQILVEELPLTERVKLSETCNPYKGISPGWMIDARDTVNNWCVAEVIKVEGNEVLVNFDGWSSKYDEVLKCQNNVRV